jgi:hypothetical protein
MAPAATVTHESILLDLEREVEQATRKALRRLRRLEGPDPGYAVPDDTAGEDDKPEQIVAAMERVLSGKAARA